jgi:hypothetical protein
MKRRTLTRDDLLQSGNLSKGQHERFAGAALREVDAKVAQLDREMVGAPFAGLHTFHERKDLERRRSVVEGVKPARRRD